MRLKQTKFVAPTKLLGSILTSKGNPVSKVSNSSFRVQVDMMQDASFTKRIQPMIGQ